MTQHTASYEAAQRILKWIETAEKKDYTVEDIEYIIEEKTHYSEMLIFIERWLQVNIAVILSWKHRMKPLRS